MSFKICLLFFVFPHVDPINVEFCSAGSLIHPLGTSTKTRWWFQILFIFTWSLGEMIQFDEHIFQMVWFNHQLEKSQGDDWCFSPVVSWETTSHDARMPKKKRLRGYLRIGEGLEQLADRWSFTIWRCPSTDDLSLPSICWYVACFSFLFLLDRNLLEAFRSVKTLITVVQNKCRSRSTGHVSLTKKSRPTDTIERGIAWCNTTFEKPWALSRTDWNLCGQ